MNSYPSSQEFFRAGGTLPPDAPCYVERPADNELFRQIMLGEFCYVLTSRQMGKSSMMVRMSLRLREEGINTAIVDLTQIGTTENPDYWYKGILTRIKRQLNLSVDLQYWWDQKEAVPVIQKFVDFFEVALAEVKGRIVIFVDEIDSTIKLNFGDDFFAGIRSMYNARASQPEFKRLSFVLLGVASPSDLIKDRTRTPFNIGQEILVRAFNRQDAQVLGQGLEQVYPSFGAKILNRIFYWTHGHPYLTQRLCQVAVQEHFRTCDDQEIDELVTRLFLSEESSRETNLQFVRDNILNHPLKKTLLTAYKKVFTGKRIPEDKTSIIQNQLKLSGLLTVENRRLIVSNQIYRRVFNLAWIKKNSEINWTLISTGILGFVVITLIALIIHDNVYLPNQITQYKDCASNPRNENRLSCMAALFQKSPILGANDYDYEALDLFFNLRFWNDQTNPFAYENATPSDLKIVIGGVYTSLADIEDSGESTRLLQVMAESLMRVNPGDDNLYSEIQHWISARRLKNNNDLTGALNEYNQALLLNPENSATLFERGRIYYQLGEYQSALRDYDQVVAIASRSALIGPTETPVATSDVSVTPSIIALTPNSSQFITQSVSNTPAILQTATFTSTLEVNSTLAATNIAPETPTISPEPTPIYPQDDPNPVRSSFITSNQKKAAVRNVITANQNFLSLLNTMDPLDYPNLRELGVFPVATETPLMEPSQIGFQSPELTSTQIQIPTLATTPTLTPAPTATFGIGSTMISDRDGMKLVYVPAGEFTMGSDADDVAAGCQKFARVITDCQRSRFADEEPPHFVNVDAFWIDQTEVTNKMYENCVSAGACEEPTNFGSGTHSSYFGASEFENYPVIYVDWNMANAYCSWVGRRLLSEAEWEKAARGTNANIYPWGNAFDGKIVNFCDTNCGISHADQSINDGYADVSPVGNYPSGQSIYGAYDMAGNVWEWVSSLYQPYPYDANDGRENLSSSESRVLRGGSWNSDGNVVRSAIRISDTPDTTSWNFGFRCAKDGNP